MGQESVHCAKCNAVGWTESAAYSEQVRKKITCGNCGYINNYVKKKYKAPTMK